MDNKNNFFINDVRISTGQRKYIENCGKISTRLRCLFILKLNNSHISTLYDKLTKNLCFNFNRRFIAFQLILFSLAGLLSERDVLFHDSAYLVRLFGLNSYDILLKEISDFNIEEKCIVRSNLLNM